MLTGAIVIVPEKAKALPDNAVFQGYVLDGPNPVDNAYVKAMLMMGNGEEINYTFTNSGGYYWLAVPGGLQYALFVADGRYEMNMQMVTIAPGEAKWVNFSMTAITEQTDVTIMGYVHDEFGSPRSDGHVLGVVEGPGGGDGPPAYANVTSPYMTGFFSVNVTAAPYGGGAIGMDFSGYPMSQNITPDPLLAGMTYWFNLTLQPRSYSDDATLSGTITDIDTSAPLENALVTVEVDVGMGNSYSNFTMTNVTGEYMMGVQSGNARIIIQMIGYTMKMYENFAIVPGANSLNAELKMTEAKVRGNVTDLSSGLPLSNARVIESDGLGNLSLAMTNDTGYYELDAFVGTSLTLGAEADGYSKDYVSVNISFGDELWYDFGLWPANAWLTGTITDVSTSLPVTDAGLHIFSHLYETWTGVDGSGHYNVTLVAGNYTIECWASNYWPVVINDVVVVDGLETIQDIMLMPFQSSTLSGNVTDAISGAPVTNAQVSVGSPFFYNMTITDITGSYSLGLAGGDYDVRVDAPGYQTVFETVHVDNLTDVFLDISMMPYNPPTTVLLRGNVTDSVSGMPVPFATVRVHFPDRSYSNQTMANDSGYYEMYVPPWQIEITAWGDNHGPTFASTNVSGYSVYDVDLQLPPDYLAPMIKSFSQVPQENISLLNPTTIDADVEEPYMKDITLMILREWNSTGTHSNYTMTDYWTTSYDPLHPSNDLGVGVLGDNYTVHLVWDTSGDGVMLGNTTWSFYLPCTLYWNGTANVITLRGYYSNSTLTDASGTALFDQSTGEMVAFWTDWGEWAMMPDPTGVFKPVAFVAEFDGSMIVRFEPRVVAELPVVDISCSYVSEVPSGLYKTIFSASDWSHGNGTIMDTVVDNTPPVADAGADQNVIENTTVTLDASASYDNFWIASYSWSYVDAYGTTVNLTGAVVNCTFNETGTYDIMLTVSDGAGWSTGDWITINVGPDMPPTAVAGSDIWTDEDTLVSFDGSGSSDDVGIANYTWTIVELSEEMYGVAPSYMFAEPGVYTVELVVTDTIGQASTPSALLVTVNDTTAPVANAGTDQTVNLGDAVTLNASGSSDNLGVVNYTWSFTDGTYFELYTMEITHTFSSAGAHVVNLTVWDAAGHSNSDSVTVTVNGPPVADAGPDQLVDVGATVGFDGSGSSDDLDSLAQLNLTWTFSYNSAPQVMYGETPSFQFLISGQYTVTLTVTDTMGLYTADTMVVTVNAPPSANAGPDQGVNVGATVSFDGSSSSDDLDSLAQLNLTWTFTYDGGPITLWGVTPSFDFLISGTYAVTLTVTDSNGLGDTDTMTVTVNAAPHADAGADRLVNAGAVVTFDASGSTDDIDSLAALNYTWSFTYGGSPVLRYGVGPTFTFSQGGVYNVTLTVRDTGGLVDVDYVEITVNLAPVASAGPDQDVNIGAAVHFDASATTDDMDAIGALNFTWSFTYSGTPRNLWGVSPSFQFSETGSYIVTLTVTDSNSFSSTDTLLVNVNGPPTANAGPDQTVVAGATATFDGSMSNDDGGASGLNYTWNGTVGGTVVTLYTEHPTYVFQTAGNYTFTLTVTDAGGLTDTDVVTITVTPANAPPVADAGQDQSVKTGDVVLFDGTGSTDDAGTSELNYTWEFVYMGRTERLYGLQPTFVFDEAGTYTVTLTVRDAAGLTSADTVTITVEKVTKSFVSQYWWSLAIIVVAAIALALLLISRRKGAGGPAARSKEPEEEPPRQNAIPPPPDDEEL
jgi:PKD repeat protein